ncbi:hypothetical protein MRB77_003203 [Cronobacter sakazakii]|nr:hypothetical protein [Cronobacter sakazakii]
MNNDELIAAGHELAKCLDSDTPLMDIAPLLSKMATQLDVTTAALRENTKQCDALATENALLKSAIQTHSESVHFCKVCGKDDPCSTDDVCYVLKETPATEAFLREVRAQGVEEFVKRLRDSADIYDKNGRHEWADHNRVVADDGNFFAAKLRQGGDA